MMECIKQLTMLPGISGQEDAVREAIIEQVAPYCSYTVDALGNLICEKKGKRTPSRRLLLTAHMDEVGLIVTHITKDGLLKVAAVGGIDSRVVLGRKVFLPRSGLYGVIGTKATHQQTPKERDTAVQIEDMYLDIGAVDDEEAASVVQPGDAVVFCGDYAEFGDGLCKAKALDDRAGCAVLIRLLRQELPYDVTVAFLTQEEIGLRGAKAAAFTVQPDYALVVETTTAADLPGVREDKQVCRLGKGAVVGFMDRSTIYDTSLYRMAWEVAEEQGILCQTKSMIAGGNDAGAIHVAAGGVKTLAVSIPCRYLHAPVSVAHKQDIEAVYQLVLALSQRILQETEKEKRRWLRLK